MENNEMNEWVKEHTGPGHRWEMTPKQQEANKATNKRNLKWLGIGLAVLLFMGFCVSTVAGSGTPEKATQTPAEVNVAPSAGGNKSEALNGPDEKFAALVAPALPMGVEVRHARNNADVVCQRLDLGHDPKKVLADTKELRGEKAGVSIFEAAIQVYCPQHMEVLR